MPPREGLGVFRVIQHIDLTTGEVLDGPPRFIERNQYRDRPRHSEYELSRMRVMRGPRRRRKLSRDINIGLVVYSVIVTLLLLA